MELLAEIPATSPWVIDDFSLTLRLLLAMLLGGLIGLEREQANHPAGLRTHILVCVGSALIMLLSIYGFSSFVYEGNVRVDPARLATAVITGIGFLGAGTIIFTGKSIAGLTTAASLWVVAAIGLAVGAGFQYAAVVTTILVIVILFGFNKVEQRYFGGKRTRVLTLDADSTSEFLHELHVFMESRDVTVKKMTFQRLLNQPGDPMMEKRAELQLVLGVPKEFDMFEFVEQLDRVQGVRTVTLE